MTTYLQRKAKKKTKSKRPLEIRICLNCEIAFTTRRNGQRFHHKDCVLEFYRKENELKPPIIGSNIGLYEIVRLARENGSLTYNTGKPCKYGHICDRLVKEHQCLICVELRLYNPKSNKKKLSFREKDLPKRKKEMFYNVRRQAISKDIEFDVEIDDVIWNDICPILGVELDYFLNDRGKNTPSFDRVDSSKGYIKGNVEIISNKANSMKSNGTIEVFINMVEYMRKVR